MEMMTRMDEENALAEERMALHQERLALKKDKERFELELLRRAPRRYRFLAWFVDVWTAGLAAKILAWSVPILSTWHWFLVCYFVLALVFTKLYGQSIGKMAFELRVISESQPDLSWITVILRETVGRIVTLVSGIGLIFPFFNHKQLSIHDLISATMVISTDQVSVRKQKGR